MGEANNKSHKKRVPEWLNSPMWSSPAPPVTSTAIPPDDPPLRRVVSPPPPPKPTPPPPPLPAPTIDRPDPYEETTSAASNSHLIAEFSTALSKKVVSIGELQSLACQGIPDQPGIRPTVWKLLLGYLPTDHALWSYELEKKRSRYNAFREELLASPDPVSSSMRYCNDMFLISPWSEITRKMEEKEGMKEQDLNSDEDKVFLSRSEIPRGEHPLSLGETSVWNKYFQESEIVEQIDRDVKRTHPEMEFFSGDSPLSKSNQESLKRILMIFAKLNPGIRYVQGMNEVLAPIFYVFMNDPDINNEAHVEADTFFCFVEVLSGFRDNFCKQLDNSIVGIRSTISKLSQLLKKHDEELWRHLEVTTKVNPQFYAFRWITLLLTQEFDFANCLRIWDTLLGDPEGPQETLLRICCAMLILVRRRLLAGDFTANLKLLQNYPLSNLDHLLHVANKLRDGALHG